MRPVLLEMSGFGSFREPTSVSFQDADYFALVGPTGSGKSTVIDALTFALFGSVPRWDDRRTVSLALAPTVTRGTVRLLFDAGGQRYVVARELRRAASGMVNQKNARLERLADPAGSGAAEEDTESLAADSAVTRAVEDLLGLTFEHFCTCVVLPQGDFAEFLHARPADRQKILVKLLGLGVYESIGKTANAHATEQQQRADLLSEQLGAFADATDDAAKSAAQRVDELERLTQNLAERLPRLEATAQQLTAACAEVSRLETESRTLAAVAVPDTLADLADRHRTAQAEQAAARSALLAAEVEDDAARDAVTEGPSRGWIEQLARDHAELAALQAQHPQLAGAAAGAAEQTAAAESTLELADQQLTAARQDRDAASAAHAAAEAEVERLRAEAALLAAVTVPGDVAELSQTLTSSRAEATAAEQALHAAEIADVHARAAQRDAPAAAGLEKARQDHLALTGLLAELPTRRSAAADAQDRLARARESEQHGVEAVEAARAARDTAAQSSLVAALRPALHEGQPCPVCEQAVREVPPALHDPDLAAAEARLAAATSALDLARKDTLAASTATQDATNAVNSLDERIASLRNALTDAPASVPEVEEALAAVRRLDDQAQRAEEGVGLARDKMTATRAAVTAGEATLTTARAALLNARDPLVPLGAPTVDADDLVAGWNALAEWASELLRQRQEHMTAAAGAATTTQQEAAARTATYQQAETAATAARAAHTQAVTAADRAHAALTAAENQRETLVERLVTAPSELEVTAQLKDLAEREAAAQRCAVALRAARSVSSTAEAAVAGLASELAAARASLVAVRDPLVALGAPAIDTDDIQQAWSALAQWAAKAAHGRDEALATAVTAATAAAHTLAALEAAVVDLLADTGILLPPGKDVSKTASGELTSTLAAARAAHERVVERRAHAADLLSQRQQAQAAQQVARTLALLLRADAFPRWLVASALDTLVAEASATLADLSGGQFELTHDDGDFLVIDHTDADSQRPVKTLSGGETFQASLSLALALSAQLSSMSAAGAARLDSIFLDEGFGTLDEATLDVVAGTLETLATRGDRMVGVVTHVPALAERVPVRYRVHRDATSSRVDREDL